MTEFEKAKKRYEAKKAKIVPLKKNKPEVPKCEIHIKLIDCGHEHEFSYSLPALVGTRLRTKRDSRSYGEAIEKFLHKEFGRWQLIPR